MSTTTMTAEVTMTATGMQCQLHTVAVRLGCEVVDSTLKPLASLRYPGPITKPWRSRKDSHRDSRSDSRPSNRLHEQAIPGNPRGRMFGNLAASFSGKQSVRLPIFAQS